jgi:hypothetical protein
MEGGVKLPRPKEKIHGNLLLVKGGRGDQKWLTAKLTDGKLDRLPELIKARVSVISDHGMVIHGTEVLVRGGSKSNVRECPQCWWVFVWTQQAIDFYDGDDPLENIVEMAALQKRSAGP